MSQFIRRKADPSKLQAQLEAVSGNGGFKQDLTEWKLTVDQKTKEGTAVIRFLQPSDLEGMEEWPTFVTISSHFVKRDGKFYVENCTGGTHKNYDGCPVCQWRNAQGWDWSSEADKKTARETGTGINTSYWANIMVIKDPANPDNDGKVFKYKFTNTVLKMIISAQKGDEEVGEAPIVITDFDNGANFLVRSTKKDKFGTLETSKFQAPSPLPGIDNPEVQKAILEGLQDLRTIVAPTQFKPFDELKKKFDKIMGIRGGDEKTARKADDELDSFAADMQNFESSETTKTVVKEDPIEVSTKSSDSEDGDDLDDLLAGL